MAAATALFFLANLPVFIQLARTWWYGYAEMGHGLIAIPLAAYVVWLKRDNLAATSLSGNPIAIAPMALFAILAVVSTVVQWVFLGQFAVWLLLICAIWYAAGASWLKELRFPLLLLLLAVPPPAFMYTRITFELQILASRLGEFGLELLGYSVLREGNILHMVGERLSVAEACSGIRSLVTLIFFVIVYGYFLLDDFRTRVLLVLTAIPVAIAANGLRIVATGVLAQYDRALAHGITHDISGYITLFAGGAFCILLEQFLRARKKVAA